MAETEAGAETRCRPGAVVGDAAGGHVQGAGGGSAVGPDRAADSAAELRVSGAHRSSDPGVDHRQRGEPRADPGSHRAGQSRNGSRPRQVMAQTESDGQSGA